MLFGTYLIGTRTTNTTIQGRTRFTDFAVENGKVHFLIFTSFPDGITTNGSFFNEGFFLSNDVDGYYVNFDQSSNARLHASYLGGNRNDNFTRFKVVGNDVHLVGTTSSSNIPVTNASALISIIGSPASDGIYYKINATNGNILTATYLGGNGAEIFYELDVVGSDVNLLGSTSSTDFPVTNNSINNSTGSSQNIVYAKVNSNSGNILLASYVGGTFETAFTASRIFMDGDYAYLTSQTHSIFP